MQSPSSPADPDADSPTPADRRRRAARHEGDIPSDDWMREPGLDDASLPEQEADADVAASLVDEVESVLAWLQQQGYLDESRFVESRIHARSQRWGQRRIEQELGQHGLSLDASQRAQLAEGEWARATELLRRKFGASLSPDGGVDPALEAKQMRFLLGRGFGTDVARRAVRWLKSSPDSSSGPASDTD
ncbi:regulatory protein RecX [Roseateles amylovorans]